MKARGLRRQHGVVTIVLVVIMLAVMMMGALATAKLQDVSTASAGNSALREAALQASEVGVNSAFAAVRSLTNEDLAFGSWYYPHVQAADADGMPTVAWQDVPGEPVGRFTVRYVVERLCVSTPVVDPRVQCVLKQMPPNASSRNANSELPEPETARQFRITVRVDGPRETRTWVQSMVSRS